MKFQFNLIIGCLLISFSSLNAILPGAYSTREYFDTLRGKRVGLVINHTSTIYSVSLLDSLLACGIQVVAVLTPEHGFEGKAEAGVHIRNSLVDRHQIPVLSLYGKRYKPASSDLQDIDIIIFDIQDVGVRFYTYISTLHYVMEACAEEGIPLIVLDRPNPNGFYIAGPILQPDCRSFVGLHPVPVVYGLTIGELATMINAEGWLKGGVKCPLSVVPCKGYSHDSLYVLPTAPSPNLRTMNAVYLYPSLCLFEGTTVNVGRGTDFPFEVYGHTHFPDTLLRYIPDNVDGSFIMDAGKPCFGYDLRPLDTLPPEERTMTIAYVVQAIKVLGCPTEFFNGYFNLLAGNKALKGQLTAGISAKEIEWQWQNELQQFYLLRRKYLLYPDSEQLKAKFEQD